MTRAPHVTAASDLNIIAGLCLIIAPFVLGYTRLTASMWNATIVGIIVAAIATMRVFGARTAGWLSWVNAALGVWLIVSPWVFGNASNSRVLWNDIILGAIILVLGAWSALATEMGRRTV